jgi:hypothetical protein
MFRCPFRPAVSLALAAATASIALTAAAQPSRRDADLMRQKVAAIVQAGAPSSRQPMRTTVTENEVNAYLAYDAHDDLPAGVVEPTVTIIGTGRVSGRAIVDLDAVRKQKNATGMLTTSNGVGRFQLESATVGGVPIPKMMLQEIVGYYSRTPQKPSGISLDEPFPLPARIREIQVERGQAVVVQ